MNSHGDFIEELRACLDALKAEGWPFVLPKEVAFLLQEIWPRIHKERNDKLFHWKLTPDRMENPQWEPPLFSFSIERHGGTMKGSTRAEVHDWVVDLDKRRAELVKTRHRQLEPMAPRYNPVEDCRKIVALVLSGAEDSWLKWSKDKTRVKIEIGMIVPRGNSKQTEVSRRKRFRAKLAELLKEHGWVNRGGYNSYEKGAETES